MQWERASLAPCPLRAGTIAGGVLGFMAYDYSASFITKPELHDIYLVRRPRSCPQGVGGTGKRGQLGSGCLVQVAGGAAGGVQRKREAEAREMEGGALIRGNRPPPPSAQVICVALVGAFSCFLAYALNLDMTPRCARAMIQAGKTTKSGSLAVAPSVSRQGAGDAVHPNGATAEPQAPAQQHRACAPRGGLTGLFLVHVAQVLCHDVPHCDPGRAKVQQ